MYCVLIAVENFKMTSELTVRQRDPAYLRILQLTDTHIFESAEADFDGLDTSESLANVISAVREGGKAFDLVLVTGDLVHEPSQIAYSKLKSHLQEFKVPVVCLPGNHDEPGLMRECLNDANVSTSKLLSCSNWSIIVLDTFLDGTHSGSLKKTELEFLEQSLQLTRKHVLIAMHHHPVSIESSWMDGMMLENAEEFFAIVDAFKQVKGIIWGHVHQEIRVKRNSVQLYGSPSTCIQFKPRSNCFKRDSLPAAYSEIALDSSGACDIQTHYISKV